MKLKGCLQGWIRRLRIRGNGSRIHEVKCEDAVVLGLALFANGFLPREQLSS